MDIIKPFWQWKEEFRQREAPLVRPREWYYSEYGRYCNKVRNTKEISL